jgi:hypothetical protein
MKVSSKYFKYISYFLFLIGFFIFSYGYYMMKTVLSLQNIPLSDEKAIFWERYGYIFSSLSTFPILTFLFGIVSMFIYQLLEQKRKFLIVFLFILELVGLFLLYVILLKWYIAYFY